MMPSRVFDIGRYTYVSIFQLPLGMEKLEDMPDFEDGHNFTDSPKWHDNMTWREEQYLMYNSLPYNKWVDTKWVKRDTQIPLPRNIIACKLRNMKSVEKRQERGMVQFRRMGITDRRIGRRYRKYEEE